jgi:transposase
MFGSIAIDATSRRAAFRRWATLAETTGSRELIAMAKTIREKLKGIITYWTFDRLSNESTEGFNNKIRWLMRQAYGFRDYFYLKLKIFQLPSLRTQKEL